MATTPFGSFPVTAHLAGSPATAGDLVKVRVIIRAVPRSSKTSMSRFKTVPSLASEGRFPPNSIAVVLAAPDSVVVGSFSGEMTPSGLTTPFWAPHPMTKLPSGDTRFPLASKSKDPALV